MTPQQAIKLCIECSDMITKMYLEDLTDAEILVRAVPGTNHIAWQLGHLIGSEHEFTEAAKAGIAPPLPAGFEKKHSKETSTSDNPKDFYTKAEYLSFYQQQRAATLKALDSLSASDLDKPAPEKYGAYVKNLGDMMSLQGSHWLMHAGQWAVIRRKLGRAPLF
jgi:hypothetical protein